MDALLNNPHVTILSIELWGMHILSSEAPHEARCEVYMLTYSPTVENMQVRAKPRNSNYLCHPDGDS